MCASTCVYDYSNVGPWIPTDRFSVFCTPVCLCFDCAFLYDCGAIVKFGLCQIGWTNWHIMHTAKSIVSKLKLLHFGYHAIYVDKVHVYYLLLYHEIHRGSMRCQTAVKPLSCHHQVVASPQNRVDIHVTLLDVPPLKGSLHVFI